MNLVPAIQIESMSIEETYVAVTYTETSEQGRRVQVVRSLMIDPSLVEAELADVIEAIETMVDKALIEQRNPPDRIAGG